MEFRLTMLAFRDYPVSVSLEFNGCSSLYFILLYKPAHDYRNLPIKDCGVIF